ncbi:porin [Photobacterium damselae subsp. damselae]|uniref:Porin-like protein H n=2 Tax=Photobacterium damselae TaxID=38293 RepID=D0YZ19_PHODD|nr:porin [Photobacterium damselae]EEZ41500.1 porin-like protein H precursor [Photobacterium damselae subsp. damselae CIP 102761]NVO60430.1 porin [Photobacterium damselae subsp. damselae]PSB80278.1 porin [Photobacterium damselae subsp. damselae]PSB81687.1 porin [Photobacterium damselae subsp. damselae]PSW87229.1 porin [Photobacterium damselae]
MKKTLLALAVMTAAGSANAAINVYDNNGVKVDLSGAAEVQYFDGFEKSKDATIRLDDGDFAINATYAINENLNVISGMAFKYESRDVQNDELWVGFSSNQMGALTFGRQLLVSDDSGIGKDYELGLEQVDFAQTEGDRVIKYVYDNGSFYAAASHELNADHSTTITDGRLGFRTNGLDVRVYGYDGERIGAKGLELGITPDQKPIVKPGEAGEDIRGYNLEAEYGFGAFNIAASFGQIEYKAADTHVTDRDLDLYEINGSYTMDKTTFALGYVHAQNHANTEKYGKRHDNVYANVTQQLHSNVKVYAEVGYADNDKIINDREEFGYVAGMEVKF